MKETFTLNKKLGEALNNKKLVYYQDCPFIVDKRINWIAAEEFFTLIGYEKKPKKWDKRPGYNGWEKEEGSFCQNLIPSDGNCDRIEDWENSLEYVGGEDVIRKYAKKIDLSKFYNEDGEPMYQQFAEELISYFVGIREHTTIWCSCFAIAIELLNKGDK